MAFPPSTTRPMRTSSSRHAAVMIVALLLPTAITWVFFIALAGDRTSWQQLSFVVGKGVQFLLPVVAVFVLGLQPYEFRRAPVTRWGWGVGFGGLVAAVMLVAYGLYFRHFDWMEGAAEQVRQKVTGLGVTTPARFVVMGVFYSVVHSFLEEYYWRWFVFRQLRQSLVPWLAVVVSSCGFMAHHILVLGTFFGWTSPWTYLFSVSVAIGGGVWAIIYEATGRLWNPWLSHLLIDAAIFAIGFHLAAELWNG